jgi:hypothetical protein
MITLLLFIAQTVSADIDSLVSWFSSFLPVILWLFIFVVFVMFIYAILKAPLDVLRKGMVALVLLAAETTTTKTALETYITNLATVFWALLGSILIFLLPLLLILMLYKAFLALVKSR